MFGKWKNEKGAMTIEASIVFTTVLLVVLMLITITHILYEQVRINALAQSAAERGAAVYAVATQDMKYGIIGNEYYTDENVYWRLFNSGKQSRIKRVEDFALKGLNQYKADNTKYDNSAVNVTLKDYYIYKRIEVEINIKYKAPFGSFLKLFMEYPYPIHAKGVAAVSEPAEMIRTEDANTFFEKNNVIQNGDFAGIDLGKSRYFENSDGYDEIELVAVYQMKIVSPIPILDKVTIVQTAKSRAFFAGKYSATSSKTEEIQMSVWELSNFERADVIVEKENIPNNMPSTFEAVRGFDEKTGKASTYITLDLNSDTYKGKANQIHSKLQDKLHKIEKFKEDKKNDISLQCSQIKSVDYYVVVPKNVSKENFDVFQKEIEKLGESIRLSDGRNVKLNVIIKQVE